MENEKIYNIDGNQFRMKDYGELTWEEDEILVNLLNPQSDLTLDVNAVLSIVLMPKETSIDIKKYDFKKGKLLTIKNIIKHDIPKRRNDFLAQ